ncbi:50S ribosomal protein L5 [Patescibacteria group bacterium]
MSSSKSILKEEYQKKIIPEFKKALGIKNDYAVPCLEKVIINIGASKAQDDSSFIEHASKSLARITGQKPIITLAKQSISGFKIREGSKVGLKVTLRGKRMYDFIQRLVNVTLPRVRDFRGLSPKSFDGKGNYTIGIKEHTAFPEISPDEVTETFGLEITIVSTAKNNKEGKMLLEMLGFPLKKK